MVQTVGYYLLVHANLEALSRAAAKSAAALCRAVVKRKGSVTIALCGGSTPREMYWLLAHDFRSVMPWHQLHLFWSDERYVPLDDPRSNYQVARETLLSNAPIPEANVHPMPTMRPSPEDAARNYEETLKTYFHGEWPAFDLILLGLGADSHTASLFPYSLALTEESRWVIATHAPAEPPLRLTLTLPVINHSANIYFLVSGKEKAEALRRALLESPDPMDCPGCAVRSLNGKLIWWVDEAAATGLQ